MGRTCCICVSRRIGTRSTDSFCSCMTVSGWKYRSCRARARQLWSKSLYRAKCWLLVKGHSKVRRWNSPGTGGSSRSIRPEARLSPAHPSRYLRSARPAPLRPVVIDPTLFAAAAPRRPVKGHAGSAHAVPPVWSGNTAC